MILYPKLYNEPWSYGLYEMTLEYSYGKHSTTTIYREDLERIRRLKRPRKDRKKHQPFLETNEDVLKRALDALEEKEKADA